jgi:hypothetical protein
MSLIHRPEEIKEGVRVCVDITTNDCNRKVKDQIIILLRHAGANSTVHTLRKWGTKILIIHEYSMSSSIYRIEHIKIRTSRFLNATSKRRYAENLASDIPAGGRECH